MKIKRVRTTTLSVPKARKRLKHSMVLTSDDGRRTRVTKTSSLR